MPLTLSNGSPLPFLGFGTNTGPSGDYDLEKIIDTALETGYRHFDTAFIYRNENIVGKVFQKWFKSGKIQRNEIFITTKLPIWGVHPERVETYIKKSLENLQLDYIDLYLIHFPVGCKTQDGGIKRDQNAVVELEGKTDHVGIWKKMEEQVASGRARYIGLSNYNIPQIKVILNSSKTKPSCLQVEIHPHLQQRPLVDFCTKNDITVVAYSPLGSRDNNIRMKKFFPYYEERPLPDILNDANIVEMARKYSKSVAQIILRFLIQSGVIPIPKSTNSQRIKENFEVFDFELKDADVAKLRRLDVGEGARITPFKNFFPGIENHPDYPFQDYLKFIEN